jgi:hypothetical protein
LVLALPSWHSQLVKIALSQQLALLSQHFAMQLVNQPSYISAKAMSASVSLSQNVSLVCVTLFLLAQR